MLILRRDPQELLESMARALEDEGLTQLIEAARTPGTVTHGLLSAIAQELADAYAAMQSAYDSLWLSRASGDELDEHGAILQLPRNPGESDDAYRDRLVRHLAHRASASEGALLEKARAVEGVREVRLVPYSHGAGSFTLQVLAQDLTEEAREATVERVRQAIAPDVPGGIVAHVVHAKPLPVKLRLRIFFTPEVQQWPEDQRRALLDRVRQQAIAYINNLRMGEELNALRLAAAVLLEGVADVAIEALEVAGQLSLADNYRPFPDEKLWVEDSEDVQVR